MVIDIDDCQAAQLEVEPTNYAQYFIDVRRPSHRYVLGDNYTFCCNGLVVATGSLWQIDVAPIKEQMQYRINKAGGVELIRKRYYREYRVSQDKMPIAVLEFVIKKQKRLF
jgi:hypothetical protein